MVIHGKLNPLYFLDLTQSSHFWGLESHKENIINNCND